MNPCKERIDKFFFSWMKYLVTVTLDILIIFGEDYHQEIGVVLKLKGIHDRLALFTIPDFIYLSKHHLINLLSSINSWWQTMHFGTCSLTAMPVRNGTLIK